LDGVCDNAYSFASFHYVSSVYSEGEYVYDYFPLTDYTDTVAPVISILYPISSTTYSSATELNYTVSDNIGIDSCWYSVDNGVTNSTPDSSCANITGLIAASGSHTWTVYANDTSGNGNSTSVSFSVSIVSDDDDDGSSSGGGSSGGGGSPYNASAGFNRTFNFMKAFQKMASVFNQKGFDLTKIIMTPKINIRSASILVNQLNQSQYIRMFPELSYNNIYQIFEINKSGFENENLEEVNFEFKVNKSFFGSNGVEDIVLKRKSSDTWYNLDTSFIKEDNNYYYFNATSPGFSFFAIYLDRAICSPGEMVCIDNSLHLCTSEKVLLLVQDCEYGCLYGRCTDYWEPKREESVFQRVGNLLLGLKNDLGVLVFYILVSITSILFIVVFWFTLRYLKIKGYFK
jgi:PGF-pre-PGF domain-containing protein